MQTVDAERTLPEQKEELLAHVGGVVHDLPGIAATPPSRIPTRSGVSLYWIPLGAGTALVRFCGRTFEVLSALLQRRPRRDLYHSALVAVTTDAPFMIEMTPVIDSRGRQDRGVVAEGTVGTGKARGFRLFRYEIRRWRSGVIPDLGLAVRSPVRVAEGEALARTVLDLVPLVPTPVWGRDELRAGEMWNSNSVTSWLLASAGLDADAGRPPKGGRAPGWDAGVAVANRRSPLRPHETAHENHAYDRPGAPFAAKASSRRSQRRRRRRPRLRPIEACQEPNEARRGSQRQCGAGLAGAFPARGVEGVGVVAAGRGRKPWLEEGVVARVVEATLTILPEDGSTHWTTRLMARKFGLSHESVTRIRRDQSRSS